LPNTIRVAEASASHKLDCSYHAQGACNSCTWIARAYPEQLAAKQQQVEAVLALPASIWLPPVASALQGFRNKAKMAVSGSAGNLRFGLLDQDRSVDLSGCPLYPEGLRACFGRIKPWLHQLGIEPYQLDTRRGELKFLLLSFSPDGEGMLRLVLRSRADLDRLKKHLPALCAACPELKVVSVNMQPQHAAIFEGEHEFVLTAASSLRFQINGVPLYLRPQSFFQTNTDVAAALYRQAQSWISALAPKRVFDWYCGVGGFALHASQALQTSPGLPTSPGLQTSQGLPTSPGLQTSDASRINPFAPAIFGIERSAEAVASARQSARELGLKQAEFQARDVLARKGLDRAGLAQDGLAENAPAGDVDALRADDLLVLNPPRRGIDASLVQALERSALGNLIYSSCNPQTLARDLAGLTSFSAVEARCFDMFPHTAHAEVAVLLKARARRQ